MKPPLLLFALALCLATQAFGQNSLTKEPDENPHGWKLGFMGTLEMGGMFVSGGGLDSVKEAGYGTISGDSVTALFSGGAFLRKPRIADISFLVSYLVGGSFVWDEIFGIPDSSFSLYGDSLAAQIEIQPLFSFLSGFKPFLGGGYSFTNGLIDEYGDGFTAGTGPFLVGGLNYAPEGKPVFLFQDDGEGFIALRISCYYRFPYKYAFKLDWDEFAANYQGNAAIEDLRGFFEGQFPARSFAFGVGLSIGLAGISL